MLLRAAGRRHPRQPSPRLATDSYALHLPGSRVALPRWNTTHARSQSPGRPLPKIGQHDQPSPPRRRLSGVATQSEFRPANGSFPGIFGDAAKPSFYWDTSATSTAGPLIVEPAVEPQVVRRGTFGHTTSDLLQNLYACVRVGRFERAENIIKRLSEWAEVNESQLIHAHETYLNARLQSISQTPGVVDNFATMRSWFAAQHLEGKDDPLGVCIIMMKAAMVACEGKSMATHIQDYASKARMPPAELLEFDEWTDEEEQLLRTVLIEQKSSSDLTPLQSPTQQDTSANNPSPDPEVPPVRALEQKSLGLSSLKSVMELQEKEYSNNPEVSRDARLQADHNMERERMLEESTAEVALKRWRTDVKQLEDMGIRNRLGSGSNKVLMWDWYSSLAPVLKEELQTIKARMTEVPKVAEGKQELLDVYGIYICNLSPEMLALNTVTFLMTDMARGKDRKTDEYTDSLRVSDASKILGQRIEDEVIKETKKKEDRQMAGVKRKRKARDQLRTREMIRRDRLSSSINWPLAVKIQIGAMLLAKFIEVAKMPITREDPRTKQKVTKLRPAFLYKMVYVKGKRQGLIMACQDLRDRLRKEPPSAAICKRLPMLVEPQPWTGYRQGGYLLYPTSFVRLPPSDRTPKDYAEAAIRNGHMSQIFAAMNALGKIPWKINDAVLRVQIEAWNTGEAIANLAPEAPEIPYAPEPDSSAADPHARRRWEQDCREVDAKKSGFHSQRAFQNLQLEIARSFRKDTIWFPHNIDFRGRAYPIPPYLNHMGADNARGLMLFAEGKELGESGLRWLKIHLANVFGYDKASFSEREEFVMKHLDDIRDSVENPLTGRKWWLKSEDAWQTLAACFELKAALDSEDPTKFISHLPTHQDGTCNGLQHYAALGGDEAGARQVNLEPGDRPSDVYTAVAEGVIAAIDRDVKIGNPIAKKLQGKITRKVVKQPVMTNVYGVTYFGAKAQVQKQLEDMFPDIKATDLINHSTLAAYIAKHIFNSLGEMFRGAQAIQEWLGKCADRIATSVTPEQIEALASADQENSTGKRKKKVTKASARFKSSVIWTTPLRFPVVQPYRDTGTKMLRTELSNIAILEPQAWDPVSRRKQMQGFPPNFIHSLDATHMMLSAIKCEENGITFASIHDSFWTHACDRDRLSELLRDAFVHMHREDVIGRLKEEFEARHKACIYLQPIEAQSVVGKKIYAWRHKRRYDANSRRQRLELSMEENEMLLEYERIRLLNSDKEEERQKGREMETPSSIFQSEGGAEDMAGFVGLFSSSLGTPGELLDQELSAADHADEGEVFAKTDAEVEDLPDEELEENAYSEDENQKEVTAEMLEEMHNPDGTRMNEMDFRRKWLGEGKSKRSTTTKYKNKTTIWLPLTFPEVPEKGNFDVRRLRQSKYFFH